MITFCSCVAFLAWTLTWPCPWKKRVAMTQQAGKRCLKQHQQTVSLQGQRVNSLGFLARVCCTQLCHFCLKAAIDNWYTDGPSSLPIKVYLQKQALSDMLHGHSLSTPGLKKENRDESTEAAGNVKWCSSFGKPFGHFKKMLSIALSAWLSG